jgi:Flp pilus assembly protein TadG
MKGSQLYLYLCKVLNFRRLPLHYSGRLSLKLNNLRVQDGSTLIEFAILAPVFIFLLMGLFEIGIILVIQNALDAGATQAARYGMTGKSDIGQSRNASINSAIFKVLDTYSGGLIDPTKVQISVKAYNTIGEADNTPAQGQGGSFGSARQTVMYTLSYPWTIPLPFVTAQTIMLTGSSITVNENF